MTRPRRRHSSTRGATRPHPLARLSDLRNGRWTREGQLSPLDTPPKTPVTSADETGRTTDVTGGPALIHDTSGEHRGRR